MASTIRGLWCLAVGLCLMAPGARGQEPTGDEGSGLNSLGDSQADLVYTPVTPCRIIDTRLAGGAITAGTTRSFLVAGDDYSSQGGSATTCGVPAGVATAAMINFVAVTPAGPGNMQVTPYGTKMPTASFINYRNGITIANGLAVALCNPFATTCSSDITIRANVNTAHLVADVQGYFHKPPALRVDTVLSNTALGEGALAVNTTGQGNTAMGHDALANNVNGYHNTATGAGALGSILSGGDNSAFGYRALSATQGGNGNSAFGALALSAGGHWGGANSAFGYAALANNDASYNSAFGAGALSANTTGGGNAAFGVDALFLNTTGGGNAAFGNYALNANTAGGSNSALGAAALGRNTTGAGNVAVGNYAGFNLYSGNDNIYIANVGPPWGGPDESGVIRIGTTSTHTATYIAGIYGTTSATGIPVYVNSSGQLGTTTSSRRYKDQIVDMEAESDVLLRLRPVSFHYRPELDPAHVRQYGLVAEEVAEVAPALVAYDEDGVPQTVRYHFVNAMLLNEVQKQRRLVEEERRENEEQRATIARLEARLAKLEAARGGSVNP